eukprot:GHRR01015555.1.p1 GENE.GHRR01015555.1~~GHRR01015555.1.p1  ORF type:complete len:723 (+),score=280.06 GHRR01015555.1:163-2331(+)
MFHIVVEPIKRQMSQLVPSKDNDYTEVFRQPFDSECVEFSAGNPRVEHITGIVHLYKRKTPANGAAGAKFSAKPAATRQAKPKKAQDPDVSKTVCCLAIPADMSVAQFCSFIGDYLKKKVRYIQVLRRKGTQPQVCMVLLTFSSQVQADSFSDDFNGMPFSPDEPEIICRLVYVRSVEVLSSRGQAAQMTLDVAAAARFSAFNSASAVSAVSAAQNSQSSSSALQQETPSSPLKREQAAAEQAAAAPAHSDAAHAPVMPQDTEGGGGSSTNSRRGAPSEGLAVASYPQQQPAGKEAAAAHESQTYAAATAGIKSSPAKDASADADAVNSADTDASASDGGYDRVGRAWPKAPAGTTELPTCPVCLDRLDAHISGIVTTVCNHRFHGECLKRWGDTSCPVCRYCMYSSNTSSHHCNVCGTNANLWICLICGHVGCGRYKQGHANDHWQESAHCYALELETQRVWDYAGDNYVHRLVQSKTDGKLLELPSPVANGSHTSPARHPQFRQRRNRSNTQQELRRSCSSCSTANAAQPGAAAAGSSGPAAGNQPNGSSGCGSSNCPECADEEMDAKEAIVNSKLDAITLEYNYLLTSQLDSQRQYFENLLAQQDARQQQMLAAAQAAAEQAAAAGQEAAAAARENERKRQQLEVKLVSVSRVKAVPRMIVTGFCIWVCYCQGIQCGLYVVYCYVPVQPLPCAPAACWLLPLQAHLCAHIHTCMQQLQF